MDKKWTVTEEVTGQQGTERSQTDGESLPGAAGISRAEVYVHMQACTEAYHKKDFNGLPGAAKE